MSAGYPIGLVSDTVDTNIGPYNYVPTQWICIMFLALFGVSIALHLFESLVFRMWWLTPTVILAGLLEVLGWSARLWSSINPSLLTPYEIQLVGTIVAPTPFIAANFLVLGRIIIWFGPQYSRLPPKLYTILFCSFDVICLVIQAVGGAIAASEASQNVSATEGGNIMLGGIVIQMVSMVIYVICAGEFFLRLRHNTPIREKNSTLAAEDKQVTQWNRVRWLVLGLVIQTTCLFIRSVYRTIELSNGWNGPIISNQVYFNVFDGAMMTIAFFAFNAFHPGFFFKNDHRVSSNGNA
ncbi:RTA1 like protein [Pisolithus orientalis]|uniref:RTA1 like protein n=1 Tax=Pisolithus orientalis TaxID=936130 RepID=UPI0022249434|nr:RTA1 like protein [Pisolithus orientalis]KAI5998517.1 RTA1 like protein [Pisolithus orientalis]